jgi:hypothetical protein
MVRIAIEKLESRASYDIQLNQPYLKVEANKGYTVHFRARADSPRSILLGFAKAHEPWTGLGLFKRIDLTSEWQNFQEHFVAKENEENGRIHFDIGESDISVEMASVRLHDAIEGEFIDPEYPPTQVGKSERDRASAGVLAT